MIPRVGRAEIFIARFIGAAILVTGAQLLAGMAATIVTLIVVQAGDRRRDHRAYGAQVTAILIVYSLPFVALMSFVSAAMASVGLALLVGLGGYAILGACAVGLMPLEGAAANDRPAVLLPSGLKPYLLQPERRPRAARRAAGALHLRGAVYAPWAGRCFARGTPDGGRAVSRPRGWAATSAARARSTAST